MARNVKQILVVDDNFEMLELLRYMLEEAGDDCQVLAVPSAEEGFLELQRTPFDLLISDLRLPGMHGFELVQRVKRVRPDMPVIIISAFPADEGRKAAAEYGVFRYFTKPLDTDQLLLAVHEALTQPGVVRPPTPQARVRARPQYERRLEMLRTDTSARQVTLARTDGEILFKTGDVTGLNIADLMQTLAVTVNNSFRLAAQLGNDEPLTIQYQAGQHIDLYSANVGENYVLAMFYDASSRRGRIGTVWVFAQRAIHDLLRLLPDELASVDIADSQVPAESGGETSTTTHSSEVADSSAAAAVDGDRSATVAGQANGQTPAEIVAEREDDTTPDEVVELVPLDPELEAALSDLVDLDPDEELPVDLDAFWDQVTREELEQAAMPGFSLEEAREQGLLPPEFDVEDPDDLSSEE